MTRGRPPRYPGAPRHGERLSTWAAVRPSATAMQRDRPVGFTAPHAAQLVGMPLRTVQDWREKATFVASLPGPEWGFEQGELYGFNDLLALKMMRILFRLKVERTMVIRFGEEFPGYQDPDGFISCREWPPGYWIGVIGAAELLPPDAESVFRCYEDDMLGTGLTETEESCRVLDCQPMPPALAFLPLSAMCTDMAESVDRWRRTRRIPERVWPPWL